MKFIIKTCLLFTFLIFVFSCKEASKNEAEILKDIVFDFENEVSFGHFLPQRELASKVSLDEVQLKNIPDVFADYEIKSFTFNVAQDYYQLYKKDEMAKEEFQLLQQIYSIDTTQLSDDFLATKVHIVMGELQNGNRAIVVDSDLNLDFKNERVQEFEYPMQFIDEEDEEYFEQNKIDFLPKVMVTYGENEEEFPLLLDPYKGDINTSFDDQKYFLSLSIPDLKTGEFQIKDKTYTLEAKTNFTQLKNSVEKFQFIVFEKKETSSTEETNILEFRLNDIINLNGFDFQLIYENDNFVLKNLGYNTTPTGVEEGFYLPQIKTKYISGKKYNSEAYTNQFQLFYFWTTWSLESLEDVPQLKQLDENRTKLAVVGVAIDANQGAVERMIARQQMTWKTLYASPNQPNEEKPALQFKVMSFPTYLLVNPEGKIIKRTHHLKEVKEELDLVL